MARTEVVVTECDECGRRASNRLSVSKHRVKVDGRNTRTVFVCDRCWGKVAGPLLELLGRGTTS